MTRVAVVQRVDAGERPLVTSGNLAADRRDFVENPVSRFGMRFYD